MRGYARPFAPACRRIAGIFLRALPAFTVIEPTPCCAPAGCGEMHRIGEDRTVGWISCRTTAEHVTVRPKYAFRIARRRDAAPHPPI